MTLDMPSRNGVCGSSSNCKLDVASMSASILPSSAIANAFSIWKRFLKVSACAFMFLSFSGGTHP